MEERTSPRPFGWGRGHAAGEFLESERWQILEEREGYLLIEAHLPPHVLNPAGQLFGGFTGTYVDYVALRTCWAGRTERGGGWLSTVTMQIHYLEPVLPPKIRLRSAVVTRRRRTYLVETRFEDLEGRVLVYATTSLLEGTRGRQEGSGGAPDLPRTRARRRWGSAGYRATGRRPGCRRSVRFPAVTLIMWFGNRLTKELKACSAASMLRVVVTYVVPSGSVWWMSIRPSVPTATPPSKHPPNHLKRIGRTFVIRR